MVCRVRWIVSESDAVIVIGSENGNENEMASVSAVCGGGGSVRRGDGDVRLGVRSMSVRDGGGGGCL